MTYFMILAYPKNCLRSRLGKHGILDSGTKITFYHDWVDLLIRFFTMEDDFVIATTSKASSEMGQLQMEFEMCVTS